MAKISLLLLTVHDFVHDFVQKQSYLLIMTKNFSSPKILLLKI